MTKPLRVGYWATVLAATMPACQETHSSPADAGARCALAPSANVALKNNAVALHGLGTTSNSATYTWSTPAAKQLGTGKDLTVECSALDGATDVVLTVSDGDCTEDVALSLPANSCPAARKDLAGAYDLHFELYEPQDVRIYLVRTGTDEYAAQIEDSAVGVTATADGVKLVGWSRSNDTARPGQFEADHTMIASDITLARDSTGALSGDATIAVSQDHSPPTNQPATLAPANEPVALGLTADRYLNVAGHAVTLPWAQLFVRFGRGIAVSEVEFERQLRVATDSGSSLTPTWTYSPERSSRAHVGASLAISRFAWEEVIGQTLMFELPEGFADAVGAAPTASKSTATITVADVGKAAQSHEFAGPSLNGAGSPQVAFESGTPACEGSCARIGPVRTICNKEGIAGMLDASAGHKVVLRTRIASAQELTGLVVDIALVGDDNQETAMGSSATTKLEDLGSAAGTYHFVSPWRTMEIELPGSPQRVGFELRVDSGCHYSTSPSPPEQTVLLVDRIAVE